MDISEIKENCEYICEHIDTSTGNNISEKVTVHYKVQEGQAYNSHQDPLIGKKDSDYVVVLTASGKELEVLAKQLKPIETE